MIHKLLILSRKYINGGDNMQLSTKERMLLEDERHQEEICVQKYQNYSQQADCPELKQLFSKLASEEQHHYDILNQILNGQQPDLSHSNQNNPQSKPPTETSFNGAMNDQSDSVLCSDLLSTEKYVSGTYDTAIFECANPTVRQALQHIQQEEQHHGQELFQYMHKKGMYTVK